MQYLLVAGAVLVAGAFLALVVRSSRLRAAVAVVTQAAATALVLWTVLPICLGGEGIAAALAASAPLGQVSIRVDALSAFFLAWSLPLTLLGSIYALGYLRPYLDSGRNPGPHFALLNIVSLSFLIVYSAQNALIFLLGWELAAVSAWLLVIWDYRNQKVRFAGFNYLVSTHVGLLALVAAFMYLHGQTGSMTFSSFGRYLVEPSGGRSLVFLLLCVSFALKSAFFPVHSWLPRAHAAAPAHVSALMSGVIHKAGLFAFLRFTLLLGEPEEWMGWAVLTFGALSAFFGVLYTASQRDLKRVLGYSSTENVGIAAMAFGVGYLGLAWHDPALVALGMLAGVLHIFNHALFKCLLFYAAGAVYRAAHTVDIERLGGLLRRLPHTGVLFLVGALAISGLPPFNGFVSEFVLYAGLFRGGAPSAAGNAALVCAAALLGFVGAVSALSMVRAFGAAFLGTPRDSTVHVGDEAPPSMLAPMYLHAAGVLVVGVVPALGVALAAPVVALFAGAAGGLEVVTAVVQPLQVVGLGLVAALVVVGAVGWARGRGARSHVTWGCGYNAPNARMQYTGSSFGQPLVLLFASLLPQQWRRRLPRSIFPARDGQLEANVPDGVERRIFEVLGRGEDFFVRASRAVPEEPRFAFAAGLALLLGLVAALLSGGAA